MSAFINDSDLPQKFRAIARNGPYDTRPYGGNISALTRALLGLASAKPGRPPKKWAGRIAMDDDDEVVIFEISASHFPEAASALVDGFGWPASGIDGPPDMRVFRHSVSVKPTDIGFRLTVENDVRLDFRFGACDNFPRLAWTRDKIVRMSCMAVADCVLRFELADGKAATVCRGFRPSALFDGLKAGRINAHFDLRMRRGGRAFGLAAFRTRAADFALLYESARRAAGRLPAVHYADSL